MLTVESISESHYYVDKNKIKMANIIENDKIIAIIFKDRFGYRIKLNSNYLDYIIMTNEDVYDLYKDKIDGNSDLNYLRVQALFKVFKEKYTKKETN